MLSLSFSCYIQATSGRWVLLLLLGGGQSQCLDEDQLIIKHLFFTHFILLLFLACNLNQSDANVVDADGGAEHQVLTAMISIRANWTVSPQLRDSSHEHHLSVSLYFISQSDRDNYADQMTMITWTIWFDQFMSPEQIFESSWTSFMPCITFKSTPTDLTPVKIILHQIFQSAPCEDGGAAAALRRSPRYRRHAGHHQCSSDSAKLSTTLSSWWKCDRINVHWSSLSCHPKESFPRKCSVSSWTGVSDIY